jgi:Trk-type K+ transport system membrane component
MLSISAIVVATLTLLELTAMRLDQVLFEVVSALATVGLSTGLTADLPTAAHVVLTVLMFVGRLGPITLATALALRSRERLYERPEGRPIIG